MANCQYTQLQVGLIRSPFDFFLVPVETLSPHKGQFFLSLSCFTVIGSAVLVMWLAAFAQSAALIQLWLFGGFFLRVQEYVRLISPWCQMNIGSCRFMLAQCYLANGEGHKVSLGKRLGPLQLVCSSAGRGQLWLFLCLLQALQCFQEAATEVEKEEFLMRLTGSEEEEPAASSPRLHYYNKVLNDGGTLKMESGSSFFVIWRNRHWHLEMCRLMKCVCVCVINQVLRLLEDVGLPELVIQLVPLAITEAGNDVNTQVTFWTWVEWPGYI